MNSQHGNHCPVGAGLLSHQAEKHNTMTKSTTNANEGDSADRECEYCRDVVVRRRIWLLHSAVSSHHSPNDSHKPLGTLPAPPEFNHVHGEPEFDLKREREFAESFISHLPSVSFGTELGSEFLSMNPARPLVPPLGTLEKVASAVDLFGGVDCAALKPNLLSIPSLSRPPAVAAVDSFCAEFAAQLSATDPRSMKRHFVNALALRFPVLDSCNSIVDRVRAMEVINAAQTSAEKHTVRLFLGLVSDTPALTQSPSAMFYIYKQCTESTTASTSVGISQSTSSRHHDTPPATPKLLPEPDEFMHAALQIPSLSCAQDQLRTFCDTYLQQACATDPLEREEGFFRLLKIKRELLQMCQTEEDKEKQDMYQAIQTLHLGD
ncbi:hypothetical protein BC830DRAFT_1077513 [Chytriomyces sp. MP71]|nr:hypothetical protein BC830DRAFT_1077513 [Chytriomyces sp. MP71]